MAPKTILFLSLVLVLPHHLPLAWALGHGSLCQGNFLLGNLGRGQGLHIQLFIATSWQAFPVHCLGVNHVVYLVWARQLIF